MKPANIVLRLFCAVLLIACVGSAAAQSAASFPARPVRIINPYAPGGASDALARVISDRLAKDVGQSFIIENRAGGGTVIGVNLAAKANPDGYTLLITTDSFFANNWLQPDLPYNSLRDLTLVAPLGRSACSVFHGSCSPPEPN
jgi:tripartite-type tricarboxylate transporter receptor subunit TctC